MTTTVSVIREFWSRFVRSPLYDSGFGDAVTASSVASAEDEADLISAMSYLHGFADCAKLACPYMSPSYRTAAAISGYASVFYARLSDDRDGDRAFPVEQATALVGTFTVELTGLVHDKRGTP